MRTSFLLFLALYLLIQASTSPVDSKLFVTRKVTSRKQARQTASIAEAVEAAQRRKAERRREAREAYRRSQAGTSPGQFLKARGGSGGTGTGGGEGAGAGTDGLAVESAEATVSNDTSNRVHSDGASAEPSRSDTATASSVNSAKSANDALWVGSDASEKERKVASKPWKHEWDKVPPRCDALFKMKDRGSEFNEGEQFLWELARQQIGMDKPKTAYCGEDKFGAFKLIKDEFGQTAVRVSGSRGRKTGLYEHIWKNGNDNIRQNMKSPTWGRGFEYSKKTANLVKERDAFTFAREPMSRFESAWREYFIRCPKEMGLRSHHPLIRFKGRTDMMEVTSPEHIKTEINHILSTCMLRVCKPFDRIPMKHLIPQASILMFWEEKHLHPSFVGHLETFSRDWEQVDKHFGIERHRWDKRKGSHESATHFYQIRESLTELYETQPEYLRVICVLYFFDFHCFDYKFPPQCEGVVTTIVDHFTEKGFM